MQLVCHVKRPANTQFSWETLRFDSPDQRRIGAPPIRRRLSSPQRLSPLHFIDDVLQGVVGLVVEEDFIVEVGAGAVAGVADQGDDLAALDRLALADLVPLVMSVEGLEAEAVGEDQGVAVAREGAGEGHHPIGRGADGGPRGGGDVDPGVLLGLAGEGRRPGAEAGGDMEIGRASCRERVWTVV